MLRFTTLMSGHSGGPYYSTFYTGGTTAGEASAGATALRTYWDGVKGYITSGGTITLVPEVDYIDPATGNILDTFPATFAAVATTGNAALPKATQFLVRLRSSTFLNGKRVQGRHFIPALANDAQVGGKPNATAVTSISTHANTLATNLSPAGGWVVYSRTNGQAAAITSVTVWATEFAVLRSRRD